MVLFSYLVLGGFQMGKYIFANKLMFAIIMRDPVACKKIIEMIFPERKVKKLTFPEKAGSDEYTATIKEIAVEVEKTIITGIDSKSVRLDVLFEGDQTVYDIEMQMEEEEEIPKRSRYYHMAIARNSLKKANPMISSKPDMSYLYAVLTRLKGANRFINLRCLIRICSCN